MISRNSTIAANIQMIANGELVSGATPEFRDGIPGRLLSTVARTNPDCPACTARAPSSGRWTRRSTLLRLFADDHHGSKSAALMPLRRKGPKKGREPVLHGSVMENRGRITTPALPLRPRIRGLH